ncbi:MAG: DNA-3-methyladenine glycosylase [Candidatus Eisenbacteria bacterium]
MRPQSDTSGRRARRDRPLPRRFYARPPVAVARALLGRLLVRDSPRGPRGRLIGRIVEVEAYGGARDPASHAFRGETARNRTMFGPPGHAYIYLSYGVHHCLNVVTGSAGRAAAVLIRALEPIAGLDAMARRRGVRDPKRLTRGPGCVARALGLTRTHDGLDLTRGPLWLTDHAPRRQGRRIARSARIGISRAEARRWRFFLAGHPCVSGRPAGRPARPGPGPVRR